MKIINLFKSAFHGKGYKGYKSEEAQKKFADSLLNIAGKAFWGPLAYLGVSAYQGKALDGWGIFYVSLFFVLAILMRHEGLKVYDLQAAEKEVKESE